jgi:hypothetical protein
VELYETYQAKIRECELAIAHYLSTQLNRTEAEPPASERTIRARDCMRGEVDMRVQLFKLTGVDLFSISGFGADTLLTLAGEVGFDMSAWKTEKHFTSWLSLCPGTNKSGGKVLTGKTKRSANRAAASVSYCGLLRGQEQDCAWSLLPTHQGAGGCAESNHSDGPQARSDLLHHA